MESGAVLPHDAVVGRLTGDGLARRLDAVLNAPRDRLRGDSDLAPGRARYRPDRCTPAAVLVPIVIHDQGPTVLLTQRAPHLRDHAGQICFPGGRLEAGDPTPEAAALREAREEVGLEPADVTPVGRLDTYVTGTNYCVTPVVALVPPPLVLAPDPFEVAEAFEVPLAFVLDPANHNRRTIHTRDGERPYYVLPFRSYSIWGATAGMLVNLYEVLATAS